jgi:hypothetical protein
VGGYVVFKHKELDRPQIKTFDASGSDVHRHSVSEQVSDLEKAAMKELLVKVFDKKEILLKEFRAADKSMTGAITVPQWADVMERVTKLGLPWILLKVSVVTSL